MSHRRYHLLAATMLVALTACETTTRKTQSANPSGNSTHDILSGLDPDKRAAALSKVGLSSGESCVGTDTFLMGVDPKSKEARWSVRCGGGKAFAIVVSANATGSTSVMDCSVLKAVAKLDCYVKLEDQGSAPSKE